MTEAEWRSTDDWRAMLAWLAARPVSTRKWTLYLCGGLRQIWDRWLFSDASRKAVEVAERAADGLATSEELSYAEWVSEAPTFGCEFDRDFLQEHYSDGRLPPDIERLIEMGIYTSADIWSEQSPESPAKRLGNTELVEILGNTAHIAYHTLWLPLPSSGTCELNKHLLGHLVWGNNWPGCWLLREVFGNPLRPAAFDEAWRTVTVIGLATGIYDDKAFERMPILADALEEAGCDDADILTHCREPGVHVRGCWVVDLVLGKT